MLWSQSQIPSCCLSVLLSPSKPLDEIQPNLVCGKNTHINWGCNGNFFSGPAPWGGVKRSNVIYFQLQSQFQRFLYQTLCVFSQMKDTKHIRRNSNSVSWVMSQGWDFRVLGVLRWSIIFFFNMVMWHFKSTRMTSRT